MGVETLVFTWKFPTVTCVLQDFLWLPPVLGVNWITFLSVLEPVGMVAEKRLPAKLLPFIDNATIQLHNTPTERSNFSNRLTQEVLLTHCHKTLGDYWGFFTGTVGCTKPCLFEFPWSFLVHQATPEIDLLWRGTEASSKVRRLCCSVMNHHQWLYGFFNSLRTCFKENCTFLWIQPINPQTLNIHAFSYSVHSAEC